MKIRAWLINTLFKRKIEQSERERQKGIEELKAMGVTFVSDDEKFEGTITSIR